jgi:hypothetical protein
MPFMITLSIREYQKLQKKAKENEKQLKKLAKALYDVQPGRFTPNLINVKTLPDHHLEGE